MVVLVETKSLKELKNKWRTPKSIQEIIAQCWHAKELFSVISRQHFKRCSLKQLQSATYATISCNGGTKWDTLDEFIFGGANNIEMDLVFLDAFCINHCQNDEGRMQELMKWRATIFQHSKDHHIIEATCLLNSAHWFDLAYLDKAIRPILHYSKFDPVVVDKLIKGINRGFVDYVDAHNSGEVRMKAFVKEAIESRWGKVENFNTRVRNTIVKAMEVSKVSYTILLIL